VHLGCLADCRYVQARRSGRTAFYKVADMRVVQLVLLARTLASDNASALAACVRIPTLAGACRGGEPLTSGEFRKAAM
jgi:hypothetical protein